MPARSEGSAVPAAACRSWQRYEAMAVTWTEHHRSQSANKIEACIKPAPRGSPGIPGTGPAPAYPPLLAEEKIAEDICKDPHRLPTLEKMAKQGEKAKHMLQLANYYRDRRKQIQDLLPDSMGKGGLQNQQ